jgi:hypothetical protein
MIGVGTVFGLGEILRCAERRRRGQREKEYAP